MTQFELVVPAYNEAPNLKLYLQGVKTAAESFGFSPETFQLVVVENGSTDNSRAELFKLKAGPLGDWFKIEVLPSNRGYGHGIWTGLKSTTAPFVGWSHADLQCDPRDAFKAYELLKSQKNPNVFVKGIRSGRNFRDRFVSAVFEFLARLVLKLPLSEINAQPKVFPRNLLSQLPSPPNDFAFDVYVLSRAVKENYTVLTIPVVFPPRIHGVSSWAFHFTSRYKTILKMIRYLFHLRKYDKAYPA